MSTPLRTKVQTPPISHCSDTRVLHFLLYSKIKAIIRNKGDVIGYAGDNFYVGPKTAAAKQSLLRLLPYILPADSDKTSLYRLVLEHGDFGVHNMSITLDANGRPLVTSLYDWELIAFCLLSCPIRS